MITDPISDMLTRIRNAVAVKKSEVMVPFSTMKFEIAKILKHEDYIDGVVLEGEGARAELKIALKYSGKVPALTHVERVSRPGQRVYVTKERIPVVLNNFGIAILSTSRGLMTDKQARKEGVGGELLCKVW